MLENHYKIPSSFLWKLKSIQKIIGFSMIQCEYERYSCLGKLIDFNSEGEMHMCRVTRKHL